MRGLKELFLPPAPPVSLPEMQDTTFDQDSYLDRGTEAFLDQFRRSLSKVPNLTGQFDLRKRKLKAKGGYALVYEAPWTSPEALPGTPPIQVIPQPFCTACTKKKYDNVRQPRSVIKNSFHRWLMLQNGSV